MKDEGTRSYRIQVSRAGPLRYPGVYAAQEEDFQLRIAGSIGQYIDFQTGSDLVLVDGVYTVFQKLGLSTTLKIEKHMFSRRKHFYTH